MNSIEKMKRRMKSLLLGNYIYIHLLNYSVASCMNLVVLLNEIYIFGPITRVTNASTYVNLNKRSFKVNCSADIKGKENYNTFDTST